MYRMWALTNTPQGICKCMETFLSMLSRLFNPPAAGWQEAKEIVADFSAQQPMPQMMPYPGDDQDPIASIAWRSDALVWTMSIGSGYYLFCTSEISRSNMFKLRLHL